MSRITGVFLVAVLATSLGWPERATAQPSGCTKALLEIRGSGNTVRYVEKCDPTGCPKIYDGATEVTGTCTYFFRSIEGRPSKSECLCVYSPARSTCKLTVEKEGDRIKTIKCEGSCPELSTKKDSAEPKDKAKGECYQVAVLAEGGGTELKCLCVY